MNEVNKKYTCPMHPEIRQDKPGMCSECGMNLILLEEKEHGASHKANLNKHEGHSTNIFKTKFWVSFVLTIPILVYSELFQQWFSFEAPLFYGSQYMPFVLSSIIFFYGGWIFISSAYRELRARLPGMMTLISLAISVAYFYSLAVIITGRGETLFWELSTLVTIMLLGHWMEMRAVVGAQGALKELSNLLPDTAEVVIGDKTEIISVSELKKGDIILVKPGSRIAADGIVIDGLSDLDESIVTGESKPISKQTGSEVIAGTINGDGSLRIKITKIGEETFLSGVVRLVSEAQSSKSRLQILSDRAAYYLTIVAVLGGVTTLIIWLFFASPEFAITRMVAVLVIACPHALGLAIPLVASISTTKAARNGFLVKQRLSLEAARNIDVVLFDKTGTLTKGEFGVYKIIHNEKFSESEVLKYAASVNNNSEHPLAKSMVDEANKRDIKLVDVKNFKRLPGKGVNAQIDGSDVFVGSIILAEELNLTLEDKIKNESDTLSKEGKTINVVIKNNEIVGVIVLADVVREESYEAIKSIRNMGIKTAMITGDSEDVAGWVAGKLGIDEYFARVLPGEKAEKVKILQSRGQKVAMVGDGVNDAPALAQADLGIAIGGGTNVAIESAGIILVRNDPRDIPKIIKLSRLTYSKMIQNLFWATGYNVIAIPLAAGVLAFKGIILQPAIGALLMSISTVIAAINAIMLRGKKLN